MTNSKARREIAALREAALEDLFATTDDQLRQEILEEGDDPSNVATHVRSLMRESAASVRRQRLANAKEQVGVQRSAAGAPEKRPTLDRIKQIIQGLNPTRPELILAFRDGKKQTDADWLSLYDNLVALGAIVPDDHEN